MISCIFNVDGKQVELSAVGDPKLREDFVQLQARLAPLFQSVLCPTHHRPVILMLGNAGSSAKLNGFGGCCEDLNSQLLGVLKRAGYSTENWTSFMQTKTFPT